MKSIKLVVIFYLFCSINMTISTEIFFKTYVGLNIYCDPIETYYPGGSPLFDENNKEYITLNNFQKIKD